MDTYRTVTKQNTTGNPLCDKLQREFRGRGLGAAHVQAASTSEMIRRIQMGLDPYENAPDPAKPTVSDVSAVYRRPVSAKSVPADRRRTVSAPSHAVPKAQSAPRNASGAQRKSAPQSAAAEKANAARRTGTLSRNEARSRSAAAAVRRAKEKARAEEVRVREPFPYAAVSMLVVFTVMFMVLLFSFAQNYELTSEISALEDQAQELVQLERDLSVQLEERDDIRVIEDIAVNEIGMVKNDLVESRFVSISGGDRVELAESGQDEEEKPKDGIFSTMLSALGENWDRLMEYID